jgi:hypothetical protein
MHSQQHRCCCRARPNIFELDYGQLVMCSIQCISATVEEVAASTIDVEDKLLLFLPLQAHLFPHPLHHGAITKMVKAAWRSRRVSRQPRRRGSTAALQRQACRSRRRKRIKDSVLVSFPCLPPSGHRGSLPAAYRHRARPHTVGGTR